MPKESKKFINPLLRPSQQEAEPKQETPAKQEKSASVATVQASNTQRSRQIEEQEERSKQTPPDPLDQEVIEPGSHKVSTNGARSHTAKAARHLTASERQTENAQETSTPALEYIQTYEPQAETLRPGPNQTILRPETPSYTTHIPDVVESIAAESEERAKTQEIPDVDIDESDDEPYDPEVDFTVTTTKAKRKRGEQAFEKTHVRFTVWVDKSLRQSFEDLALQRDKPKTTLLNEAIADLVRKYEAH